MKDEHRADDACQNGTANQSREEASDDDWARFADQAVSEPFVKS